MRNRKQHKGLCGTGNSISQNSAQEDLVMRSSMKSSSGKCGVKAYAELE